MAWPADYTKYQEVTIDNTKVSADLTDYPIYIDLSNLSLAGADIFDTCRTDGGDIRVTKSDGTTELPREVVSIDTTAKTGELHVKYSGTLSSSADTTIRIWYNGTDTEPAASATYGSQNVWSDYVMVHHMTGASATDLDDSTANANDVASDVGTPDYNIAGKIGQATGFDQVSDEELVVPDSASLDIGGSAITLQAWRYSELSNSTGGEGPGYRMIMNKGTYGTTNYYIAQNSGSNTQAFVGSTDSSEMTNGTGFVVNTWQMQHYTHDGSNHRLYVNGTKVQTTAQSNTTWTTNASDLVIGSDQGDRHWRGYLDELRIRDSVLSDDWISTEHNNHNTPSTFYSVGAEQTSGGSSAVLPSRHIWW